MQQCIVGPFGKIQFCFVLDYKNLPYFMRSFSQCNNILMLIFILLLFSYFFHCDIFYEIIQLSKIFKLLRNFSCFLLKHIILSAS